MTDMIAAEPALAERLVHRLSAEPALDEVADAIRRAAVQGQPVLTTGCGTSEHAAMAVAEFLADALRRAELPADRVVSVQAFELAGRLPPGGVLLAISHEGGTWATNLALERAAAAGMDTALVSVGGSSPAAAIAQHLLLTGEQDQSWCHTVGYLSPLVAGTVLAVRVAGDAGEPVDAVAVRALLDAADDTASAETMAAALASCARLLVIGSGIDYVSARELALKVEEGARLPATAHQLETLRHGHLAAATDRTGLVLLLNDAAGRGAELVDRAAAALRAARELRMPAAAILGADLGDDLPAELTPAGRAAVPLTRHLPRVVSAALGSAIPLQILTERLSRDRGVNPDTLARDDPRQAAAGDA